MSLSGKNVLITGASHGIGAAAALAFAKEGCNVGVNFNKDKDGAGATARKVREQGRKSEIYQADVSLRADCEAMLAAFLKDFGSIDILINNAGGALKMPEGGFADMPMDYWDSQINLNLNAAAYCSHAAVKDMLARKAPGSIVNISSVHSLVTYVKRKTLPYCAAKGGLNMFTKSLGVEVAKHGIRVNCVAPGFIQTKLSNRYSEAQMNAFKRKIPAGFLGSVDDIVPLILFLADLERNHFIVGQTFVVDGGQSIDGVIDYMLDSI